MASEYSSTTNQLFSLASSALGQVGNTAANIGGGARPTLGNTTLSYKPGSMSLGEVPKFSDLFNGVDKSGELITQLDSQVDAWIAKYFPSINGQFKSLPEDWCANVISGVKPYGTDSTIFDLIWQQSRDRAYRATRSEQRNLEANLSSRGFTLPIGALVDTISQSEQRATSAILDVNREQAIKDADIKVELLKQAVSMAATLKMGILNTSAEYFRSYYSVHNLNNETAKIRGDAYRSFYGALSSYYNVEVSFEELRLRAATSTADVSLSSDRNKISLYGSDGSSKAWAQASRGFADIASHSASAAGTLSTQIQSVS
ncbi:hypothetical protein ACVBEG_03210 [Pseudomonas sp. GG8]